MLGRDAVASANAVIRCDALLFDLDGVLVDSAECVHRVCTTWAISRGLDPAFVWHYAQGRRVQETVRGTAPHLDLDAETAALVAIESTTTEGLHPVPGANALIDCIPKGSWAIVTSGHRAVARLRLTHVGIPIPDVLVCADDVQNGKPDPEGYLTAARRLGVAPESCVVVEDTPTGLEAAGAAGMRSIGVAGTFARGVLADATIVVDALASLRPKPPRAGARLEIGFAESAATVAAVSKREPRGPSP
jgi:sugar-phosphatase